MSDYGSLFIIFFLNKKNILMLNFLLWWWHVMSIADCLSSFQLWAFFCIWCTCLLRTLFVLVVNRNLAVSTIAVVWVCTVCQLLHPIDTTYVGYWAYIMWDRNFHIASSKFKLLSRTIPINKPHVCLVLWFYSSLDGESSKWGSYRWSAL